MKTLNCLLTAVRRSLVIVKLELLAAKEKRLKSVEMPQS